MTISLDNNVAFLNARSSIQKASNDVENTLNRLSTGKRSAFVGDRVAESGIAASIKSDIAIRSVGMSGAMRLSELVNVADGSADSVSDGVQRMLSLAAQSGSDIVSDEERAILQEEFVGMQSMIGTLAEQAQFNGVDILSGRYASDSSIQSKQKVSRFLYNVSDKSQYASYGVFGENSVLEDGSSVTVTDSVGKERASGSLHFSKNLTPGDRFQINGTEFVAVDGGRSMELLGEHEFLVGENLGSSLRNFVASLSASSDPKVSQAIYSVQMDNVVGSDALSEDSGAIGIQYTTLGSRGNDFGVSLNLAGYDDKIYRPSYGSLTFENNLSVDSAIAIGNTKFYATDSQTVFDSDGKKFLIGRTLGETVDGLVDRLYSVKGENRDLSNFDFYAVSSGGSGVHDTLKFVDHDSTSAEGSFIGFLEYSGNDAISSGDDKVLSQGERSSVELKYTSGNFEVGDRFSVAGYEFLASDEQGLGKFAVSANADTTMENLAAAINDLSAEVSTGYGTERGEIEHVIEHTAANYDSTTQTLRIYYNGVGEYGNGKLLVGFDFSDGSESAVLNYEGTDLSEASGILSSGGADVVTEGSLRKASLNVKFGGTQYSSGESVTIGNTTYSFSSTATGAQNEIVLGSSFDQDMDSLVSLNQNDASADTVLSYDSSTKILLIKAKDAGLAGNSINVGLASTSAEFSFTESTPVVDSSFVTSSIDNIISSKEEESVIAGSRVGSDATMSQAVLNVGLGTSQYTAGESITIGNNTYSFASSSTGAQNEVILGSSMNEDIEQLVSINNADGSSDVALFYDDSNGILEIRAKNPGSSGDNIAIDLASSSAEFSFTNGTPAVQSGLAASTIGGIIGSTEKVIEGSYKGSDGTRVITRARVNDGAFRSVVSGGLWDNMRVSESDSLGKKGALVVEYNLSGHNYMDGDELIVGGDTYRVVAHPGSAPMDVKLGDTLSDTLHNLMDSVNDNTGSNFSAGYVEYLDSNGTNVGRLSFVGKTGPEENTSVNNELFMLDGNGVESRIFEGGFSSDTFSSSGDSISSIVASLGGEDAFVTYGIDRDTQIGEDRTIDPYKAYLKVNGVEKYIPYGGVVTDHLTGGMDYGAGVRGKVTIDFSASVDSGLNFSDGDVVELNSNRLEFVSKEAYKELTGSDHLRLDGFTGYVPIEDTFDETMVAFVLVANSMENSISDARFRYDSGSHRITVEGREVGSGVNKYTFNVGKSGVLEYDVGLGLTRDDKTWSIGKLAENKDSYAVKGSDSEDIKYFHGMRGTVEDLNCLFVPGNVGNGYDEFVSNKVKFFVRIGGLLYETGDVFLSGGAKIGQDVMGEGYNGLGGVIAPGTDLVFRRVGATGPEAGIVMRVGEEPIVIPNASTADEIQSQIDEIFSKVNDDMDIGGIKLGINAVGKEEIKYGLDGIDQFVGVGEMEYGNFVEGGIGVLGFVGEKRASSVVRFDNNNFSDGDYFQVNGAKMLAYHDFHVEDTLEDTLNNLVYVLNTSKDKDFSQALYRVRDGNSIVVESKYLGSSGNDLTLSLEIGSSGGNGIYLNGSRILKSVVKNAQIGAASDFTANYHDDDVSIGSNVNSEGKVLPLSLKGGIESFSMNWREGSVISDSGNFTPNSLELSVGIGGEVYSGRIALSGGYVKDGEAAGLGFNGLGNYLAPGTKLILGSSDGVSSVYFTVGKNGLELGSGPDESASDIRVQLKKMSEGFVTSSSALTVQQRRIVSSFNEAKTVGTVLDGIKGSNVYYQSDEFDENGSADALSDFHVDTDEKKIWTKVGSKVFSQSLKDSEDMLGLGSGYDSDNDVIFGGVGTTLRLREEDADGAPRYIIINLQGVSDIDISTTSRRVAFEGALNKAFGTSAFGGLRLQVGGNMEDFVTFSFPDLTPEALFVDEEGAKLNLSIASRDEAGKAFEILSKTQDYVRREIAKIGAAQAEITAIKDQYADSIRLFKVAVADLEDVDLASASSEFTLSELRTQASSTAFMHAGAVLREVIQRVLQS